MTKLSGQVITLFRNKLKCAYRKRKISNVDKHIERLLKSVYPTQAHDYVMLKIKNRDFPCDAPLFPSVKIKKLVQLGFCCQVARRKASSCVCVCVSKLLAGLIAFGKSCFA